MRLTRSSSKVEKLSEYKKNGIGFNSGDAVFLKGNIIGIIVEFYSEENQINANIHKFTTQELLDRMEFRNKKNLINYYQWNSYITVEVILHTLWKILSKKFIFQRKKLRRRVTISAAEH